MLANTCIQCTLRPKPNFLVHFTRSMLFKQLLQYVFNSGSCHPTGYCTSLMNYSSTPQTSYTCNSTGMHVVNNAFWWAVPKLHPKLLTCTQCRSDSQKVMPSENHIHARTKGNYKEGQFLHCQHFVCSPYRHTLIVYMHVQNTIDFHAVNDNYVHDCACMQCDLYGHGAHAWFDVNSILSTNFLA